MKLTIEVEMDFFPPWHEVDEAKERYEPTPESPEPDWEWICEDVAMERLGNIKGVTNMTITDSKVSTPCLRRALP